MKDDDTTIEDGVHELFVYKVNVILNLISGEWTEVFKIAWWRLFLVGLSKLGICVGTSSIYVAY